MSKKSATIKLIVWSIVLILIILMTIDLAVNKKFTNWSISGLIDDSAYQVIHEENIEAEDIDELFLKCRAGEVRIYKTSEEDIKIIQKGPENFDEREIVDINKDNGKLSIVQDFNKARFFIFGFGTRGTIIEVYLPEKEYEKIALECTSGTITIKDIISKNVELKASSGKIELENIKSENMELNLTSGNIEADNIISNYVKANATSGKIELDGEFKNADLKLTSGSIDFTTDVMIDSLNCKVTSGRMDIIIPENDGFDLESSRTSGRFNTEFEILSSMGMNAKNIEGKYKEGGSKIKLEITSGRISLDRM